MTGHSIHSGLPGIVWPAVPSDAGALLLALQYQFDRTQWLPPGALERHQLSQLDALLRQACAASPFWRDRLASRSYDPARPPTREWLATLPVLTRADVQRLGDALLCREVPPDHGQRTVGATSGSTGTPIRFQATALNQVLWRALTLREHLWHRRDFGATFAVIRAKVESAELPDWGPPASTVFRTGPSSLLDVFVPVGRQADWLIERDPHYLLSHASNVEALAREFIARGARLPRLREVRTMGEVVTPELRRACREAWGARVTDMYSAQEVGYIAFQCPEYEHYHVQSENVLVEILDDEGRPCAPGQSGAVVVTSLNNFAMPLVRYGIGDYATVGEPCACGRGLPVLTRILGRVRNMLTLPNGDRRWPMEGLKELLKVVALKQFQLVQKDAASVEVNLVLGQAATPEAERTMTEIITRSLGHPFRLTFRYHDEIPRSPSGKYEEFRSEIGAA